MKARHKRFALIAVGMSILVLGAWLIISAFNQNMNLFYTPSEILAGKAPQGRTFRMGGMVEKGSVRRQPDGVSVAFVVTDTAKKVPVRYKGILPDLFKEGKGVVAQGMLGANGEFVAAEVLAKHDENYMPPEAAEALKNAAKSNEKTAASLVGVK